MSGFPPTELRKIAEEVAGLLRSKGESVAVVETAAGGLISSTLLSIPGASKYYKGGLTLYTLPSRIEFAGWTQTDIEQYRGPTPAIVAGLAKNVRGKLQGSTYVVAESGTAGPDGGSTRNRTPGYVALAVSNASGEVTREIETGSKDREANMIMFAKSALELLRDVIKGDAKPDSASEVARV